MCRHFNGDSLLAVKLLVAISVSTILSNKYYFYPESILKSNLNKVNEKKSLFQDDGI